MKTYGRALELEQAEEALLHKYDKSHLMDWWCDLIKEVCRDPAIWPGDLMNTRKKSWKHAPMICDARKRFAENLYDTVGWRSRNNRREYLISPTGEIPDGWRHCSFPDLTKLITGGNHTTFIRMGIGQGDNGKVDPKP